MLVFFRNNQVSTAILLAIFTFLVRIPAILGYITPDEQPADGAGMLYEMIFGQVAQNHTLSAILSAILVFIQGLLVNWLINRTRVNPERNWLGPLLYVVVVSAIPDFLFLSAPLVAATFFPLTVRLTFQIYKSNDPTLIVFDTGFLIGVAALFYVPAMWYFLPILLGLAHVRSVKVREIVVFFGGLAVPGFLGWVYALWHNSGSVFRSQQFGSLWQFWNFQIDSSLSIQIRCGLLALLFLTVLLSFNAYYFKRLIQVQKYNNILYWLLLTTCVSALLRNVPTLEHFLLAGTSVGIFLALSFQNIKNKAIAEVLFFSLIVVIECIMFI